MAVDFTDTVMPSDFQGAPFVGSCFQSAEMEGTARNIVIFCYNHGDRWFPFSLEEYGENGRRVVSNKEQECLEQLIKVGALTFVNGKYCVTSKFIGMLAQFVEQR